MEINNVVSQSAHSALCFASTAPMILSQLNEVLLLFHQKVSIQIFNISAKMGQEFWCIGFHRVQDQGMTILGGLSAICHHILKSDLMAPNSFGHASWSPVSPVVNEGSTKLFRNFNILYGTSMACPHAVGAVTLMKAVHPE
ncbi:PREDICTED: subtilisin-like protease SBT1.9 [Nelumbo nucifera]|uniref:Subtilisin-like protease SBT1.9 n=1 Tax=Nelumbo nucifera TaxID=4432 RepID=A0A1U8Q5M0_NELNU|nr:PREDICTED: subtilisin-like protease SBT1.9 [Nelumbo nucifera]